LSWSNSSGSCDREYRQHFCRWVYSRGGAGCAGGHFEAFSALGRRPEFMNRAKKYFFSANGAAMMARGGGSNQPMDLKCNERRFNMFCARS
jgi:hypothetical protein